MIDEKNMERLEEDRQRRREARLMQPMTEAWDTYVGSQTPTDFMYESQPRTSVRAAVRYYLRIEQPELTEDLTDAERLQVENLLVAYIEADQLVSPEDYRCV
jgi:hypothetical protein